MFTALCELRRSDEAWRKHGFVRLYRLGGGRGSYRYVQVRASPSAPFVLRHPPCGAAFLSSPPCIVSSLRAELDCTKSGGNTTWLQLRVPVPAAKPPPLCFCADSSQGGLTVWSGVDVALPLSVCRKDDKDYALKQIEGTGISMSACREIAVRTASFASLLF